MSRHPEDTEYALSLAPKKCKFLANEIRINRRLAPEHLKLRWEFHLKGPVHLSQSGGTAKSPDKQLTSSSGSGSW